MIKKIKLRYKSFC